MSRWNVTGESLAAMSIEDIIEFPFGWVYYELSDEELILFEAEAMRREIWTDDVIRESHPHLYDRIVKELAHLLDPKSSVERVQASPRSPHCERA
jgi:hypothetical protein